MGEVSGQREPLEEHRIMFIATSAPTSDTTRRPATSRLWNHSFLLPPRATSPVTVSGLCGIGTA